MGPRPTHAVRVLSSKPPHDVAARQAAATIKRAWKQHKQRPRLTVRNPRGGSRRMRKPVATANVAELRVINGRVVLTHKLHVVTNSSGRSHVTGCKNGKRINYWIGTRKRSGTRKQSGTRKGKQSGTRKSQRS